MAIAGLLVHTLKAKAQDIEQKIMNGTYRVPVVEQKPISD